MQTINQEIDNFMKTFRQLSDYGQSILIAQVQLALVAETAIKRQYGLTPEGYPAQTAQPAP